MPRHDGLVNFRVKIPIANFAYYSEEDLKSMGRLISILQKDIGWEWKHYNERLDSEEVILFEAEGVQPEVAAVYQALQKRLDLEPMFSYIVNQAIEGEL